MDILNPALPTDAGLHQAFVVSPPFAARLRPAKKDYRGDSACAELGPGADSPQVCRHQPEKCSWNVRTRCGRTRGPFSTRERPSREAPGTPWGKANRSPGAAKPERSPSPQKAGKDLGKDGQSSSSTEMPAQRAPSLPSAPSACLLARPWMGRVSQGVRQPPVLAAEGTDAEGW